MQHVFPNIRHLRSLIKVADLGNISRAAEAVHLSQPAVTHALLNLEQILKTTLFNRLHRGMSLTNTGEVYVVRARRALANISMAAKKIALTDTATNKGFEYRVTTPQLKALIALADARSFSSAARNSGLSQPSIHRAGRDLERVVGRSLFLSTNRGIDLSPAAETLVRYVRLALDELQQGYFEVAAIEGKDSAKITVGSLPLARTWVLPTAFDRFLKEKPHVQIITREGSYAKLSRDLRQGQIDFLVGALRLPASQSGIHQETLFEDTLSVVVRFGHPLTKKSNVTLADTLAYPWVAPPKQTPAGTYLAKALGIAILDNSPVKVVSSSLILVRGMLMANDFVTIISSSQVRHELDNQSLVALPIPLLNSSRPIGISYREDWQPTTTQNLLLQIIRDTQSDIIECGSQS